MSPCWNASSDICPCGQIKEIGPLIQFDEQKLMALAALFQFRQYEQGAVVHQMGDPSTCIYHIVRGQVSEPSKDVAVQRLTAGRSVGVRLHNQGCHLQ